MERSPRPVHPAETRMDLNATLMPHPGTMRLIRMADNSMSEAHIPPNALLVVHQGKPPREGDIVVAMVDGEYLVRRLLRTRRFWVLHAHSPAHRPQPLHPEISVSFWGVVTAVILPSGTLHL